MGGADLGLDAGGVMPGGGTSGLVALLASEPESLEEELVFGLGGVVGVGKAGTTGVDFGVFGVVFFGVDSAFGCV